MATLKQLIADGLQVGALVECHAIYEYYGPEIGYSEMHVYQYNGNTFQLVFCNLDPVKNGEIIDSDFHYQGWQLATAYDSHIDPETLPIPEPFWTGWVVNDGYKFEPVDYGDNGNKCFEDGWHREYLKSDCQPCLPPK